MKRFLLVPLFLAACGPNQSPGDDDGDDDPAQPDAGAPDPDAEPGVCAAGSAGVACVIDLHEQVAATCDAALLADLTAALEARRGEWPLWSGDRALFVTDAPAQIAGGFNEWREDADATTALCGSGLSTAIVAVASGRWPYKLITEGAWHLDAGNWGFVFDDFAGNPDGKNSVVNTHDSGLGHLVQSPDPVCSEELGNCRMLTTYLPAGYDDPANVTRAYPVVFMHDGQNVFDDHDCCFGHTGWEVNVTLDADIASGANEPVIVVAADHGGAARNDEYGWSTAAGGKQETFMAFQIATVQPTAAALWRLDPARIYVAGSSLGGLISMRLALDYPDVYAGAAAISGAFWPGQDTNTALRDELDVIGKVEVPIYIDHGGHAQGGGDGYEDSVEIRDQMVDLGWERSDSPSCTVGADALCYHWEPGATHDELAWRYRSWRFLRFFVGAAQ